MFTYTIIDNKNFSRSNPKLLLATLKTKNNKYGYFSDYAKRPPYVETTFGLIKTYLSHKLISSLAEAADFP